MCFANKHQQWNPSPCGGKAYTEVMQIRLCPEQLRQVGRQTQGMAGSHIQPACLWTGQRMQVIGPWGTDSSDCPVPADWVSLHTAHGKDTTSASWASWSLPHQCHGRSPAPLPGHGVPPSWASPCVALVWPQLIPRKCTMPGAGLPWCPALPHSWLIQSARDGPGSALPPQWSPCGPSLFLTESKWHQGQGF